MQQRDSIFYLTTWILDRIFTGPAAIIAVPFVTLMFIIWFLRWITALRSGERLEDMDEMTDSMNELRNRSRQARSGYGPDLPTEGRYRRRQ